MFSAGAAGCTFKTSCSVRRLGVRITRDDLGTGDSSPSLVHSFPLSRIKIDRSSVQGLGRDPQSSPIVRAILGLSRSLGHAVTAEGIETEEQRRILTRGRCPDLQGYPFGRPEAGAVKADAVRPQHAA